MSLRNVSILLVDDNPSVLEDLGTILRGEGAYVHTASNGAEALDILREIPCEVCLSDLKMPEIDGIELLREVKRRGYGTDLVIVTGYGTVKNAVEAMKEGAADYLTKPVDPEELLLCIQKIMEAHRLAAENRYLWQEMERATDPEGLLGESEAMGAIRRQALQIARSNATVLIQGESGTGKELMAHFIHNNSARSGKSFIRVSCAALSEGVLESELFGHERGAFSGALRQRKGRFELADGGTLFLDEIGAASEKIQLRLLRVLQEREFERVGGTQTIEVDVRLITATNKDLEEEVRQGNFREDLLYRINVIPLEMPPLRDRTEDIPLLTMFFLTKYAQETDKPVTHITDGALCAMTAYTWPGNVRELENAVERMVVLADKMFLDVEDLPERVVRVQVRRPDRPVTLLKEARDLFERDFLKAAMRRNRGNISRIASEVGLTRKNLYVKLERYGLDPKEFRA